MTTYETEPATMRYAYYNSATDGLVYGHESVAKRMTLNMEECDGAGGSPPGSGALSDIMKSLHRNFNEEHFIKGHLLNHRLGGVGNSANMFPITAQANSLHYNQVEREICEYCEENDYDVNGYYNVEMHYHGGGIVDNYINGLTHNFDIICTYEIGSPPSTDIEIGNSVVIPSISRCDNILYDIMSIAPGISGDAFDMLMLQDHVLNMKANNIFESFIASIHFIANNLNNYADSLDPAQRILFYELLIILRDSINDSLEDDDVEME